jgi:hypothetical protein
MAKMMGSQRWLVRRITVLRWTHLGAKAGRGGWDIRPDAIIRE